MTSRAARLRRLTPMTQTQSQRVTIPALRAIPPEIHIHSYCIENAAGAIELSATCLARCEVEGRMLMHIFPPPILSAFL